MTRRQSSLPPHVARLYSTAKWQRLRKRQLEIEPRCVACLKEQRLTAATVADHIERATDEQSFWEGRLQSLCSQHHASKRQAESRRNEWQPRMMGSAQDGTPLDPNHHWNR